MKRTAFIIIIIAVASLSPTARSKTAPATLSKERIDYAVEYDRCKSSLLGRVGDEMGEVEALQAVSVHFLRAFGRMEERMARLEARVQRLEASNEDLKRRATDTEAKVKSLDELAKAYDADLGKLFKWARDVDDDLFGGLSGGTKARIEKAASQISSLAETCRQTSDTTAALQNAVDANAAAIRDLATAIRSARW